MLSGGHLPDLLRAPGNRGTLDAILDKVPPLSFPRLTEVMANWQTYQPRGRASDAGDLMMAATQWGKNVSYYVASRTDLSPKRKAAVFDALRRIIEERTFINSKYSLWSAQFFVRPECYIFSGPEHRVVIFKDSGKMFYGEIPKGEQTRLADDPGLFYRRWNSRPDLNGLVEVVEPNH